MQRSLHALWVDQQEKTEPFLANEGIVDVVIL